MVMSRKTQLRHRAREIALQLVYMNDMRPGATVAEMLEEFPVDEAVTLFDGELRAEEDEKPSKAEFPFVAAFDLSLSEAEKDEVMTYAADLLRGVRANAAEIEGFRRSMVRDGVALVRFLMWLKPAVERGGQTEMSVSERLRGLRAADPMYRDLSFDTIAGYQEHGAIVHYEADGESDAALRPEGMILIDSGAQYADGTTDITRTVALGPVTNEQRRVYTLVLKGHLQLQNMKFPYGASGTQLDAAARMAMWREGMNYLHGTGHGVGSYLNVHEGPHQIRMEWRPAPFVPGMTVTDEPGLYLQDRFGVRTENMLIVKDYMETEFGRFLEFEPLTLCPIDKTPIIVSMLTDDERAWLDDYHRRVYERLSPYLLPDERLWLENACSPL